MQCKAKLKLQKQCLSARPFYALIMHLCIPALSYALILYTSCTNHTHIGLMEVCMLALQCSAWG